MKKPDKTKQKGSALIYILIAIALLAALTATFMDSSSQQTSSQSAFNTVTDLNAQINLVRSTIQECVLTYPAGDDALVGTTNTPYPINPTSTYFNAAPCSCQSTTEGDKVALLRCPGNPGNSNEHAQIFGGSSGKFMPPSPKLFANWEYYNGPSGVFFYTSTDKTDSFLKTALNKLDDQFSECEADVVDNMTGGALALTSDSGGPSCPANSLCFRVWMIAKSIAIYPGDTWDSPATQGDEAAASCP